MLLILKLCLVAVIWTIGVYFGATASSDPAGEAWAHVIPVISALIVSSPVAFWISRTPVSGDGRRHRRLKILLHVPLAIAVSPLVLIVVSYLVLLLASFIEFVLVLAFAGLGFWLFRAYRKRRRARRAAPTESPPAVQAGPELPGPRAIPAAPVAIPPMPPRVKKPVCGILAWVLPFPAALVGIILAHLADRAAHGTYEGFKAWGLLAWAFAPLFLALCISPVLAIVSLRRRERYPALGRTLLVLYVVGIVFAFLEPAGVAPVVLAGSVLLAGWLVWQYRRKRAAQGTAKAPSPPNHEALPPPR